MNQTKIGNLRRELAPRFAAKTEFAMNQTKIGNRFVAIAGIAPANETTGLREPIAQRPKARRIVVIRNGKSVGRRRGR